MLIHFEPGPHRYQLNGKAVPSVTKVLELITDFSMVPRDVLEAARVFGTHVHEAVHLYDQDELELATLDPALKAYVDGWAQFIHDEQIVVIESEVRVAHPGLGYAGTLDKRFIWRDRPWLGDIKSGILPPTVGPQTAAYKEAWAQTTGHAIGRQQRCCVQLNPEFAQGYKVHKLADPADMNHFLSALNCYKFLEKHYGRP